MLAMLLLKLLVTLWKDNFQFWLFLPDKFSDNIQKFFDSLGEGSMDDIPEDDEDDEEYDSQAKK